MNKTMLYWVLGLVLLTVVLVSCNRKKTTSSEILSPEVPVEFRSYPSLIEGFETETHNAERITSSNNSDYAELKYYNPADSSLLLLTNNYSGKIDAPRPWMNTYVKLNKKGQITDSLSMEYFVYQEVLGHLIARDHYSSWTFDGDKTPKPYSDASLDPSNTDAAMLANFTKHYEEAEIVLYRDYSDRPTKTRTHVAYLFKKDTWFIISQQDVLDFKALFKEFLPKPHYETIKQLQLPFNDRPWVANDARLELAHFQKLKYHKETSTGAFNPNNYTRRAYWEGVAYLHLNSNNDTVPFKLHMHQPEESPQELTFSKGSALTIFNHETLDFTVISTAEGQLYTIRSKK